MKGKTAFSRREGSLSPAKGGEGGGAACLGARSLPGTAETTQRPETRGQGSNPTRQKGAAPAVWSGCGVQLMGSNSTNWPC